MKITWIEVAFSGLLLLYLLTIVGGITLRKRYHRHRPENRQ